MRYAILCVALFAVGCAAFDGFTVGRDLIRERVYTGSSAALGRTAEDRLRDFGFQVGARRDTAGLTLTCVGSGTRFTLLFTDEPGRARVKLDWSGPADDALAGRLFAELKVLSVT